jgi:hypothetical protein
MRTMVIAVVMVLSLVFPCWADNTTKEGAQNVGQGFKQMGEDTGQAIKKGGKEVGKAFKQVGRDIRELFRSD